MKVASSIPRAEQIRKPPIDVTAYNPADTRTLINACESDRDRAFVFLGFHGGLRRGEVIGVKGEDIETRPDGVTLLHVTRSVWDRAPEGGVSGVIKHPKGGKGRTITLTPEAATALLAHRASLADPRGWLFPAPVRERRNKSTEKMEVMPTRVDPHGVPLPVESSAYTRVIERLCKSTGVKLMAGHTTHGLRKTAATALAKGGASAWQIADHLGHSGIGMVKYYVDRENAANPKSASMIAGYA